MDYSYEKIEEQLLKLPADLQQAVTSVGVAGLIRKIADDNKLHIDQSDTFFGLTTYVMLGLLPINKFKQALIDEVAVSESVASALILEINQTIFSKVRESLQKIQEDKAREDADALSHKSEINAVEKAGGFVVEPEESRENNSLTLSNSILTQAHDAEMLRKEDVIKDIENPPTVKRVDTSIIGFTMKGPIIVQKQVEIKAPVTPTVVSPAQSTPKGPDPYREPMI